MMTPSMPTKQPSERTATPASPGSNGTAGALPYLRPDAPAHGRYVTKEEYWATYYEHPDASYEWNGGYLEAKPMPNPLQYKLFLWFVSLLKEYNEVFNNGLLMGLETGFSLTVPNLKLPGKLKETVRKPDVAFVRYDNPVPWGLDERSYSGICDLCVEVISDSHPTEIERDTQIKLVEYEFAGVQEYYILDEEHRYTKFYQRNRAGRYVEIPPDRNGVIRSATLPGFQFRQRDLRTKPPLETLAQDVTYQGYVLLAYQAAQARAAAAQEQATAAQEQAAAAQEQAAAAQEQAAAERRRAHLEQQRAEAEQQRAEAEQQRAEAEQQRAEVEQQRAEAERQRADEVTQQLQAALAEIARLRGETK